jgi:hypothetical protein
LSEGPRLDECSALLVDVVRTDGAELQQVNTDASLPLDELEVVFAAAPRLQVLSAGVSGQFHELLPVLRNEPPYGPLRINELDVEALFDEYEPPDSDFVRDLAAALAAHESLEGLLLSNANYPPVLNALVEAAERRVSRLTIWHCALDPDFVPALVRVLQQGSLTKLEVSCPFFPHAPEESMPVLCAALRACPRLAHLTFQLNPYYGHGATQRAVTELLNAVVSLPALNVLNLSFSRFEDNVAAGRAIGALLGANLPTLHTLGVVACQLGDEGMEPLLDGLAANTHLRELDCHPGNDVSRAFLLRRMEPAVTAVQARAVRTAR